MGIVDYSCYRPTDSYWVGYWERRMGAEAFWAYRDKVYSFLMDMPPGTSRHIDTLCKAENREVFIKIVCLYITEGSSDVLLSDDYTEVMKKL